jgi:predicted Zn-dependent protease
MKRILVVALATIGLTLATAATSVAAKPVPSGAKTSPSGSAEAAYWGHWTTQAVVYDGTGGNTYVKVAEAVSEWRKSGWNVVTTSDPSKANITVVFEMPTTGLDSVGGASLSVNGGVISACSIKLDPILASWTLGEHTMIHELGHCGGLPHSTSTRSVMYPTVSSTTMMTAPSSYDIRWMSKDVY